MPAASVRISPWIFQRARKTRADWELVAPYFLQKWIIAIGHVTPRGVIVHGDLVPWPSRRHARLWHRLARGINQDQMDRLMRNDRVSHVLFEELPWSRLSLNLLGAVAYPPLATWPDPAASDLALVRWIPLYRRTTRDGRTGWIHPTLSAFFIPDSDLLAPIIQRIPWDTPETVGTWLSHAIDQWERYEAPDDWFEQADATHLTTERLMGMQFAMWTSMGMGYFDATAPLSTWLDMWPPDPDWVLALKAAVRG